MPYNVLVSEVLNAAPSDKVAWSREFDLLRAELDDIRSAVAAIRALLVASTAVGAGYNVASTNIGTAITATPGQTPRFTAL